MKWNRQRSRRDRRAYDGRLSDPFGLRRQIEGISQKMLTQTLRRLEADGFITRRVFATVPVTVENQLTPLGRSLNSVLDPLRAWAEAHMSRVQKARGNWN